jgi:citrate lyase subunit beta / citryl-CoA lyase
MINRSLLFLPGNTPNILINGDVLGADSLILDLEDAIAPSEKDSARILVRNTLKNMNFDKSLIIIRINPIDSIFWKDDLNEMIPLKPDFIMPPKVNSKEDIDIVSKYIEKLEIEHGIEVNTIKLMPLIETSLGIENAFSIASSDKRVTAIFLGAEDLTADLQCKRTKEGLEIFYSRGRIVSAARACDIDVYDTPFTDIEDLNGMYEDAKLAKSLGFSGKAVISPRHVEAVNKVFTPTLEEIEYAHEVMETIRIAKIQGKGVVSLRGKMIDSPIVKRAERVLSALGGEIND